MKKIIGKKGIGEFVFAYVVVIVIAAIIFAVFFNFRLGSALNVDRSFDNVRNDVDINKDLVSFLRAHSNIGIGGESRIMQNVDLLLLAEIDPDYEMILGQRTRSFFGDKYKKCYDVLVSGDSILEEKRVLHSANKAVVELPLPNKDLPNIEVEFIVDNLYFLGSADKCGGGG